MGSLACPVCGSSAGDVPHSADPTWPILPETGAEDSVDRTGMFREEQNSNGPGTITFHGSALTARAGVASRRDLPRVDGFRILEELGRGGMGVVYRAVDLGLNRPVALKMILLGNQATEDDLVRFRLEAEAAARLHHPHIVQVHRIGEHDGLPYVALELVDGESLARKIDGKPWPALPCADLVEKLARAMAVAHRAGIVHRDLKPANILVDGDGAPKIADFGLAKRLDDVSDRTRTGTVIGTPSYMAPEQAAGTPSAGPQAAERILEPSDRLRPSIAPAVDIYSLGAILYELLTGRPPFVAATPLETVLQVIHAEPAAPTRLNPGVPRDLETICLKCLRKDPNRRYSSALDLAEDLRRFRAGEPILARPMGRLERVRRWGRRNPLAALLAFSLIGLLAAAAIASTLVAFWMMDQRDRALALRADADRARAEATDRLWNSYLAQARAGRWSGKAGRRFDGLQALTAAAGIRFGPELRDEAIACLVLPDLRLGFRRKLEPLRSAHAALNPTLDRYARYDAQGNISIRRLRDDAPLLDLPGPGRHVEWILRFSPQGTYLLVRYADREGKLHVWDLERSKVVLRSLQPLHYGAAVCSPDEKRLAAAETDGKLRIYDLHDGRVLAELPLSGRAYRVAFHPHRDWLAVSRLHPPGIDLFDLAKGKAVHSLGLAEPVRGIAWNETGNLLAAAGQDGRIRVWRVSSAGFADHSTLEGHQSVATRVAFAPRGPLLASMGWDGTTRLWNVEEGKLLVTAQGGFTHFHPAGDKLGYINGIFEVGFWELESGDLRTRIPEVETQRLCAVEEGGRLAFLERGGVALWCPQAGKRIALLPGTAHDALFLPGGEGILTIHADCVRRWPLVRAAGGVRVGPSEIAYRTTRGGLGYAVLDQDGNSLLVRDGPDRVVVVSLKGDRPPVVAGPHPSLASVALNPEGSLAATGTWNGDGVKIWNAATGALVKEFPVRGSARMAFRPHGSALAVATLPRFDILRTGTWETLHSIERQVPEDVPGSIAYSPDGRLVALGLTRFATRLYDAETLKSLGTLSLDDGRPVHALHFSADGTTLYEQRGSGIHAWDLLGLRRELADRKLAEDWPPLARRAGGPRP